jgi:hypothetical protein
MREGLSYLETGNEKAINNGLKFCEVQPVVEVVGGGNKDFRTLKLSN